MRYFLSFVLYHCAVAVRAQSVVLTSYRAEADGVSELVFALPAHTESVELYKHQKATNPILGQWTQVDGKWMFDPSLELDTDESYALSYVAEAKSEWFEFKIPGTEHTAKPRVMGFYPTADTLPENLLRLYIEFNQPMQETGFMDQITFADETGEDLSGVFLPSRYEYWNKARTKLTLIFDPGRVKTGLRAHKQLGGRALKPGKKYTLTVKQNWHSMAGEGLVEEASKTFVVSTEDMRPINPEHWSLRIPECNGKNPISIDFGRVLDHINAQTFIRVVDSNGQPVPGKTSLTQQEAAWQFVPDAPWLPGDYAIYVYKKLEDVAGNNLLHGFDVLKASARAAKQTTPYRILPFKIN